MIQRHVLQFSNVAFKTFQRLTSYGRALPTSCPLADGSAHSSRLPLPSHSGSLPLFDNLGDKRVLCPVIKVLYALHTLLERIAASKTLERRGWWGGMNKEVDWGGSRRGRAGRLRHGVKMQIMKRGGGGSNKEFQMERRPPKEVEGYIKRET